MAVFQIKPENHIVRVKPSGAGSFVAIACATGWNLNESQEMAQIRCIGVAGSAAAPEPAGYSATASLTGTYRFYTATDATSNVGLQKFREWMRAGTRLTFEKETNVAGGSKEVFDGFISSVTEEAISDGPATYSVEIAITGLPVTSAIV